jgi:class 3 adenylate cyclase
MERFGCGQPNLEADRRFGRTVIPAARIAAQAQGGEILAAALLRELAQSNGDPSFGAERVLELKGIAKPRRDCYLQWQPAPWPAPGGLRPVPEDLLPKEERSISR